MLGRAFIAAVGSFIFPGFGHAVAGRPRWAIAWAAAVPVAMLLVYVSMWFFLVSFALRLACAFHAFWTTARSSITSWFEPLVFIVGGVSVLTFVAIRLFMIEGFKTPSSSMYPTLQIGDHLFIDKLSPHWRPYQRGEVVVFVYPCDTERDYIKRIMALGGDTVEVRCNVVYVNGKPVPNTLADGACSYDDRDDMRGTWFARPCSRYHETVGGLGYDVFHDPERPARDQAGAPNGDSRDFPMRGTAIPPSCREADDASRAPSGHVVLGTLVDTKPDATACEPQLHYVVPDGSIFVLGDNRNNSNDSRVWGAVSLDAIKGRAIGIWLADGKSGLDWTRVGPL